MITIIMQFIKKGCDIVDLIQEYFLLILFNNKRSDFVAIGNFTAYSQTYLEM